MRLRGTTSALACIIVLGCTAFAQPEKLTFSQLRQSDGLTSNSVTAITQDSRGFVWIATSDGLNRYDGYNFTTFRTTEGDSTGLSSNSIGALCPDPRGDLWIGTIGGGLCKFSARTGRFSRIDAQGTSLTDNRVQALFRDSKGMIWVGTYDGLGMYDPANRSWKLFRNDPDNATSLSNNRVNAIVEDKNGLLWIGTSGGLNVFNRGTGLFRRYVHNAANPYSLPEDYISALSVDSDGTLWIGTLSGMLGRFDRPNDSFSSYMIAVTHTVSLFSDNRVTSILEDASGRLWIGVLGNGITVVSRNDPRERMHYGTETGNPQALSSNDITCQFRDAEGLIWIGTSSIGINTVYSKVRRFEPLRLPVQTAGRGAEVSRSIGVTCFAQRTDGIIVIGAVTGGVFEHIPTTAQYTRLRLETKRGTQSDVQSLLVDRSGNLWVGTFNGLACYDHQHHLLKQFEHDPANPASLSSNSINCLFEDKAGLIWVGTAGNGLNSYDPSRNVFTRYQNDLGNPSSISSNLVSVVFEDREQRLWVGTTDQGLNLLDRGTGRFRRIPYGQDDVKALPGEKISSLAEDQNGLLWIGTNKGLCALAPGSGRIVRVGKNEGLPGPVVTGILPGTDGNLWVGTTEGLARVALRADRGNGSGLPFSHITAFDVSDGLQDLEFYQGACLASSDGRLYFGGRKGYNAFNPASIVDRQFVPQTVLTEFLLFNKRVTPGDHTGILGSPIESTDTIRLAFDQNVLSFEFAALSYLSPEKNRFMYWLQGFDRDRNFVDANKRFATYTNLAPGEYVLHVRGANADGSWSTEDTRVYIIITPPWWRTYWAFAGYAVAFVSLLILFEQMQKRRVIRRERSVAQLREAELRAEAAELQASAAEQQARAVEAQARAAAAQAEVAEARAKTLQAENERKELELEKARELEKAYTALDESLRNLHQTQDQLIHAEKMASLGALTAGIAHEIRNPLNFITNFSAFSATLVDDIKTTLDENKDKSVADISESVIPDLDDLSLNVQKINEHGKRAESIVKSMLLHSRGKSGEQQPTDLTALLDEAANLAFHGMKANGMNSPVLLEKDFDPSISEISVVPQEISRVVLNLLNNAFYAVNDRAALGEPGYEAKVRITSKLEESQVRITVEDNASGIPDEIKAKIFEPFFTTKPTGSGTGLGLSLSYDIIVKGHHGSLSVESTVGKGTSFIIVLPYVPTT